MRSFALVMAVFAALVVGGSRAEARYGWYPWCAWLADDLPGGGCYFTTLRACWATVRGVGGYCGVNPYPPPPATQRYRRRRHRRYYQ